MNLKSWTATNVTDLDSYQCDLLMKVHKDHYQYWQNMILMNITEGDNRFQQTWTTSPPRENMEYSNIDASW